MRNCWPAFLILLLACQGKEAPTPPKSGKTFKQEFRAIWDSATTYTMDVLERMPKKEWDQVPAEGSMTFREHALHIEGNLHGLTDRFILEKDSAYRVDQHDSTVTKEVMKKRLQKAFNKVEKSLQEMPPKAVGDTTHLFGRMRVPKSRVFLLMRDHMTHHRAQMIIALRQAGKEPPDYRGW